MAALRELLGGWPAGCSKLNGPFPEPKVAVGLWLWKHHRQAWPGFTPYPHSLQMRGEGFPAAPHLCSGKAWGVKLGEGCQNPMACGLLCSKHRAAAFPSHFLPPFTARSKTSSLFAKCHPLAMRLLPPAPFQGRRDAEGWGRRVQTVCSRQWEGSIPDWMLARLPSGSSQPGGPLLPSLCWGRLCPFVLHIAGQGPPGKGNRKKALRGSRRGAERDSSPFSFTLSFLKGHAKLKQEREYKEGEERTQKASGCPSTYRWLLSY